MSQKALSMRKIREVLRLRYGLGLLQNEIARSCSIGQASVHRYLERAAAAGFRASSSAIISPAVPRPMDRCSIGRPVPSARRRFHRAS